LIINDLIQIKFEFMKKRYIIAIILILIVVVVAIFGFSRKSEIKYTTAKVERGEVLQTVSATGTIEAATKLDLRFVNSGKISEINVKIGDSVKRGTVLANLDVVQLTAQLSRSKASLNAANANLNKILNGATLEDIRVSETAVENAQIALDNANSNLVDVKNNTAKDISNAEASVNSAQVTLDNANKSYENTVASNENNLAQDYDVAWDIVNSSLLTAFDALNTNKTTLAYEDAQDTLSVLNTQYLNNSSQSKTVAQNSYNSADDFVNSIKNNLTYENIDSALVEVKRALNSIRDTLSDTGNVLQSTITSSLLSQTELDLLKSNISTARSNVNSAITNVTSAQQNISTQIVTNQTNLDSAQSTINSAQSSLDLANKSLQAIISSSESKINTANNAIKSAEGALKQAQDQLALKKAGPSKSEVALYRSQVQEAEAALKSTQAQIDDSTLYAPRDGIITEINGEVGEIVSSVNNFMSLITTENFEIKANISEVDISKVKIDDEVEITFDALGPEEKFTGKVIEIEPAQTEISGVIYYKVTTMFSGDAKIIKPGMTSNLDIMTARKENAIMIPFQALKDRDGQKYVQILEGKIARDIFVEVGLKGDINIEILNGLREGQEVVTFVEE
ncbi:MAG: efflux RND transporter periplasmic adaptor subunit, partial [Patescibacteria group bacterium]|nr:efflux RND transporter periplasmic adaptor subunit [Patescibacteria group bacterium]